MFARATSGDKRNNNRFSPCSLNAINPVLNTKARSPKGCFTGEYDPALAGVSSTSPYPHPQPPPRPAPHPTPPLSAHHSVGAAFPLTIAMPSAREPSPLGATTRSFHGEPIVLCSGRPNNADGIASGSRSNLLTS
jgi:hypothetical protein